MQSVQIKEKIKNEILTLNKEEKTELLNNFVFLVSNIESVIGLTKLLYLIVDNQILIDLSYINTDNFEPEYRRRYIRRISVLMLFNYLSSYVELNIKTLLIPTIFYELNNRNILKTNNDFQSLLNKYSTLIEVLDTETISWGLDNFNIAKRNLQQIEQDERKILNVLNDLKQQKMTFQVFDKMEWRDENNEKVKCKMFKPPFLIANQLIFSKKLKLKYFDENIVKYIIASHLEPKIYLDSVQNNSSLKQEIKGFRHESIQKTASVTKIKKGMLKGLADIEMLQFCNIGMQFRSNTNYTLFAVTFDEKLLELLQERTRLSVSMELSSRDNAETFEFKLKQHEININRINIAQEKQLEACDKFILFFQELKTLID